jgi:hypothetical protein
MVSIFSFSLKIKDFLITFACLILCFKRVWPNTIQDSQGLPVILKMMPSYEELKSSYDEYGFTVWDPRVNFFRKF